MFPTLKLKLLLAFGFAVVLTVVLTGFGSFYLLRNEQVRTERERVGLLVYPVRITVGELIDAGTSQDGIRGFLTGVAAERKVRFILTGQDGRVIVDTENDLVGQPFDQSVARRLLFSETDPIGIQFTTLENGPEKQTIYWPNVGWRTIPLPVARQYELYMSVPDSNFDRAWVELLPKLGFPALVALFVSGVIAYLLARSIARPVVEVTHASEAMARGLYDQRIPVEGRDEIGRLAASFNAMATQVGRSHQMMKDLVANVAHELKTPLTSIQGFSQALVEGAATTPEDRANAARIINDEADRMRRLVEDLLYLSQLESGQLRMEMGPVDLSALLRDAAERITWQLQDRQTAFRLNIAPGLGTITGDKRRLEQVLANLLDNAARHTPPGGAITLQGVRRDDAAVLSVTNTGSFIPPDVLPRVFERFYRADAHRTRDGRHGGLGLAIAGEIATAHQGRIEASSDPKTGTEFRLILPVPRESATVEAPRAGLAARLPLRRASGQASAPSPDPSPAARGRGA